VGLERGPLSLVSAIEELFGEKKSSGSGIRHPLSAKVGTNLADKRWSLGLTQAMEFVIEIRKMRRFGCVMSQ
jgi:hypothetical protein